MKPQRRKQLVSQMRRKLVAYLSLSTKISVRRDFNAERQKPIRLLLLGQSESGKSTTLRQFQRIYTPAAFRDERITWRAVIQLNLIRSIHTILDALADIRRDDLMPPKPPLTSSTTYTYTYPGSRPTSDDDDDDARAHARLPQHLELVRQRLMPLRHVEALLIAKLVPPNETEATHLGHHSEVFVRPGFAWKIPRGSNGRPASAGNAGLETQDEVQEVLWRCRDDLLALWQDEIVRRVLRRRKIRLEESPGL